MEEANKKRIEEQQQKMAQLKAQQQALAQKAIEESRATLSVRKVIQKLRTAQGPELVEKVKQ